MDILKRKPYSVIQLTPQNKINMIKRAINVHKMKKKK